MTYMSQFAQGWMRQKAIQEAVRAKAEEEDLLRAPTPNEADLRLAENVVYRRRTEQVRSRINELLREEGLEITVIDYGGRVALTDGRSDDYLDVNNGTWH